MPPCCATTSRYVAPASRPRTSHRYAEKRARLSVSRNRLRSIEETPSAWTHEGCVDCRPVPSRARLPPAADLPLAAMPVDRTWRPLPGAHHEGEQCVLLCE